MDASKIVVYMLLSVVVAAAEYVEISKYEDVAEDVGEEVDEVEEDADE